MVQRSSFAGTAWGAGHAEPSDRPCGEGVPLSFWKGMARLVMARCSGDPISSKCAQKRTFAAPNAGQGSFPANNREVHLPALTIVMIVIGMVWD